MKQLKFMNPEKIFAILDREEDVLTKMAEQNDQFYARCSCIECGGPCIKEGDSHTLFVDETLPTFYLRCQDCHSLFNPRNNLIVEKGNPAAAYERVPIIGEGES